MLKAIAVSLKSHQQHRSAGIGPLLEALTLSCLQSTTHFQDLVGADSTSWQAPSGLDAGFQGESQGSRPSQNGCKPIQASQFDILEWYPRFMLCHQYFMEEAQYKEHVQMVTAFTNIRLPFEKRQLVEGTSPSATSSVSRPHTHNQAREAKTLLLPYIRRLVATGFDGPDILELFFGPHWVQGIGSFHEVERRNFLFACKSSNWLTVKTAYDMEDGQVLPFLRTLKDPTVREIDSANKSWSEWLALQDWLVGPLSPSDGEGGIKEEVI